MLEYAEIKESSAERIGRRIRSARLDRGLSQGELGDLVGLNANRVQQYENGARKPKLDLLKKFAAALEIETISLIDPVVSSYIGAMYAFFEMEEPFELKVDKDSNGKVFLQFGDGINGALNEYLKNWYIESTLLNLWNEINDNIEINQEELNYHLNYYKNWKRNFPKDLTDENIKNKEKERVKVEIEKLQRYYALLSE